MTRPPMLPSMIMTMSGTRNFLAFAAQWLAYVLPYRRFAVTLTSANARLGADADRYSFTVVNSLPVLTTQQNYGAEKIGLFCCAR